MRIIIILLTFISIYLIQENFMKRKEKYDNKYLKLYEKIKIPILVTCFVIISFELKCKMNKKEEVMVFLDQPKMDII